MCFTYDLERDIAIKAGQTRSIYGSKGQVPAQDNGYKARHDDRYYVRDQYQPQMSADLRRDIARYRGAAHPLCFTDEVMEHQFPEGFKPVHIEPYDGTTDPAVWIEDFSSPHSHGSRR